MFSQVMFLNGDCGSYPFDVIQRERTKRLKGWNKATLADQDLGFLELDAILRLEHSKLRVCPTSTQGIEKFMAEWIRVANVSEISPSKAREIEHQGRVIAIFQVGEEYQAIDGICPHQGGPLAEGPLDGTCVTCPWHGWQFDVVTGKTPLGTRVKQEVFPVKREGDEIFVELP
jgi:nitrite reductase/ring-hydroxylating ferredoxin subunit